MKAKRWVHLSGGIVSESALADHSSKEKLICRVNKHHPDSEAIGLLIAQAPVILKRLQLLLELEKQHEKGAVRGESWLLAVGLSRKAVANLKGEGDE